MCPSSLAAGVFRASWCAALLGGCLARAAGDETAITIYSSAAPGAAAQFYRPGGGGGSAPKACPASPW